ncbi:hypothetical protein CPB86DRAFT_548522 [Serendipita vermifera]|nr:hypothetical protein CPB86DRAFT_548522 [Serendipita vermifera]
MATAVRHLQLYSYDQLVGDIQRTTSITLSQRDLAHPTAGLVELLYMRFIKILFSLEFENYVSDLYEECDPQYADSFVLKNILRYLRIILRLSSGTAWIDGKTPVPFDTIKISDITEPSPARTKVILSCLINLVNLHDGELKFYGSSKLQLERLTEEKTKCAKDIEALTAEVEEQRSVVYVRIV